MNRTCHHLSDSHWTNSLQLVQQMLLFWMIRSWMLRCQKCFLDDTVLDAAPLDVSLLDAAIPRPWLLPIWMIRFWMLWSWMLQFWMFRSWMLWIIPKGSVLDVIWTFWSLDAKVLDVASLGCCALGCFNTHPKISLCYVKRSENDVIYLKLLYLSLSACEWSIFTLIRLQSILISINLTS